MNKLLKALFFFAHLPIVGDDDGGTSGSGDNADRGDNFVPTDDKKTVADDKSNEQNDDSQDTSDEQDDAGDEQDDEDGDEQDDEEEESARPRGKDGKFVKKNDATIPKARFDELRQKAKEREQALINRVNELEKATKVAADAKDVEKIESEVEELEAKMQKQLDDGETRAARETMREIRMKERQIIEMKVEHKTERARQMAVEQFKVDTLLEKLESEFPVINPDSEEYDEAVVEEIVLLRTGFERGGMATSAAIAKAVKYVLGANAKQEAKAEEDTEVDDEPEAKKGLRDTKGARKQEQVKKNVEAAKKQPAKIDDIGVDSHKKGGGADSKSINDMTEEEFNALPASTKARLRGDLVDETSS